MLRMGRSLLRSMTNDKVFKDPSKLPFRQLSIGRAPTTHPDAVARERRAAAQVGEENAGVRAIGPVAPPKDGTTRIG